LEKKREASVFDSVLEENGGAFIGSVITARYPPQGENIAVLGDGVMFLEKIPIALDIFRDRLIEIRDRKLRT
jgi:hypothetical protein